MSTVSSSSAPNVTRLCSEDDAGMETSDNKYKHADTTNLGQVYRMGAAFILNKETCSEK